MITPAAPPAASPPDPSSAAPSQPQTSAPDSPFAMLLAGTAQAQGQSAGSAPAANSADNGGTAKAAGAKSAPAKTPSDPGKTDDTSSDDPTGTATAQAGAQQIPAAFPPAPPTISADSNIDLASLGSPPSNANAGAAPQSAEPSGTQPLQAQVPSAASPSAADIIVGGTPQATQLAMTPAPSIASSAAGDTSTPGNAAQPASANAPTQAAAKPAPDDRSADSDQTAGNTIPADSQSANPVAVLDSAAITGASVIAPMPQTAGIADAASAASTQQPNAATVLAAHTIVAQNVISVRANAAYVSNAQSPDTAPSGTDPGTSQAGIAKAEPIAQIDTDAGAAAMPGRAPVHPAQVQHLTPDDLQQPDTGNAPAPAQTANTAPALASANHATDMPAQAPVNAVASVTDQTPANLGSLIAQTDAAPPSPADVPVRIAAAPGALSDWQALAVRIARNSEDGASQFTIRLDPPSLGRIDVRLHVDAQGAAQAQLSADRPQTLQLLQRDAPALERALKDAGLDLGSGLSFSLNGDGRQAQDRSAGEDRVRYAPIAAVDAIVDPALAARWSGQILGDNARLDITV